MVMIVLDLFQRIYRLKTVLLSLMTGLFGLALLLLGKWAEGSGSASWMNYLPIGEIGSTLFVTGALVIAWDYIDAATRSVVTMNGPADCLRNQRLSLGMRCCKGSPSVRRSTHISPSWRRTPRSRPRPSISPPPSTARPPSSAT